MAVFKSPLIKLTLSRETEGAAHLDLGVRLAGAIPEMQGVLGQVSLGSGLGRKGCRWRGVLVGSGQAWDWGLGLGSAGGGERHLRAALKPSDKGAAHMRMVMGFCAAVP